MQVLYCEAYDVSLLYHILAEKKTKSYQHQDHKNVYCGKTEFLFNLLVPELNLSHIQNPARPAFHIHPKAAACIALHPAVSESDLQFTVVRPLLSPTSQLSVRVHPS